MRKTAIQVWLLLTLVAAPTASWAQAAAPAKEPRLGSSNRTELGVVIATGNAKSTSVGLRNLYTFGWTNALLRWEGGWLRATSRDGDRFAVQTPSGFDVIDPESAVDSHRLFSKLGYQRQLSARHDWFANFDAVRDEPHDPRGHGLGLAAAGARDDERRRERRLDHSGLLVGRLVVVRYPVQYDHLSGIAR